MIFITFYNISFKNVTSDSHFVTVDFPHEVEVPPQSCTAGQVAHISYHCKGCELCLTPLLIVLHNLLMCIKWKCLIIF